MTAKGKYATDGWLVRIATSLRQDSPNIFKLARHHDGFTCIANTRFAMFPAFCSDKILILAGFFNVPVCHATVLTSLFH